MTRPDWKTLILLAVLLGIVLPLRAADAPQVKFHAIIFDFACNEGDCGPKVADSIRLRLRRHKEYEVFTRIETQDLCKPMGFKTDVKKVAALMTRSGFSVGIHGTVTKSGSSYTAEVRCVNLTSGKPVVWDKTFSDATQRARGEIAKAVVERLRGQAEWKPPEVGDEEEPKRFGQPVNINGSFDNGLIGWDPPDNVSTFLEKGPSGRGTILRVRTDLARDPWLAYRRKLRFGQADPSNPPKIATDTSMGAVGGLEGVHYRSHWIKSVPGQRYWLVCDYNKCGGTPKIFVKGFQDWRARADGLPESSLARLGLTPKQFAQLPPEKRKRLIEQDARKRPEQYRRECYRWYLNVRGPNNTWDHYALPVPPRGGMPDNVQWIQIQVYSYWPAGTYLWDNVHLYKDPRQTAPLAVEKARTKNFGKTSDAVEAMDELTGKITEKVEQLDRLKKAGKIEEGKKAVKELIELRQQYRDIKAELDKLRIKDSRH